MADLLEKSFDVMGEIGVGLMLASGVALVVVSTYALAIG